MSRFEHLEIIKWPEVERKILDLVPLIGPWLRGNAVENAHGILEIWTDQMDQTTQEIRQLMYEGCAEYAVIRTMRRTTTPRNLLFAIYTTLTVESNPAVANVDLGPATSVWVERPVELGANITFLIVKPTRLLLGSRASNASDEETLRQRYLLDWYYNVIKLNSITHVCPSPTCRQGYKGAYRLKGHFRHEQDPYHQGLAAYGVDRQQFVEAIQNCVGWDIQKQQLPDDHKCFEIDFLAQISLEGYFQRKLEEEADVHEGPTLQQAQPRPRSKTSHRVLVEEQGAPFPLSDQDQGPIVRTRRA